MPATPLRVLSLYRRLTSRQNCQCLLISISLLSAIFTFCFNFNFNFWGQQASLSSELNGTFYNSRQPASVGNELNGTFYNSRQQASVGNELNGTFYNSRQPASLGSELKNTFNKSRQPASLGSELKNIFNKSRQPASLGSESKNTFNRSRQPASLGSELKNIFNKSRQPTSLGSNSNGTFFTSSPKLFGNSTWMESDIVNPFPYRFPLSPNIECSNKTIDLLIAVPTSRSNTEKRRAVRETWGSYAQDPTSNTILLFFLGTSPVNEKPDVQKDIDAEFSLYGDIVQSDFIDTYANLSIKSMSILKWLDDFCPETKYLIKADDDVYVVLPIFFDALRKEDERLYHKPFIFGHLFQGNRPIRNRKSKWYTPFNVYKQKVYPQYVSGTSYAMSGKTAKLIFQTALRTPLFWLEDIYLTGICAKNAGVAVVNNALQATNKPRLDNCHYLELNIIGHNLDVGEIRRIHQGFTDRNGVCRR